MDLTPAGLEDGQVFVEWYWQRAASRFLPTRNGPDAVAGGGGLGSERDFVWTGIAWNDVAWQTFGESGARQIGGPLPFTLAVSGFGLIAGGWSSQNRFPRTMADVNGDGWAEVIGFGNAGVWVESVFGFA